MTPQPPRSPSEQPKLPIDATDAAGQADDLLAVEPLDPQLLAEVIAALEARLAALEPAVDTLLQILHDTPAPGRWTWCALTPEQQHDLLIQLRDWVDWLITRYHLDAEDRAIAPCWYRHPPALEELTALWVSWQAVYHDQDKRPSDALISWHDRCLWPCLRRLNDLKLFGRCATEQHHIDPTRRRPVTDAADFTVYLAGLQEPTPHEAKPPAETRREDGDGRSATQPIPVFTARPAQPHLRPVPAPEL